MSRPARQLAVFAALVGAALVGTLALSGCAGATGATRESADGLRGQWRLVAAADEAGTIGLGRSTVTLSIDGDRGGGDTACNHYKITLTGGPGPVVVGDMENTGLMCVPLNLMETEIRYLSALAAVTAAELAGDELRLTTDEIELRFEPMPVTTETET